MENNKRNTITLPLKKKWFDLIKSGIKKEEYREIKPFYKSRLSDGSKFDEVIFTLGYPKSDDESRRLKFSNASVRIGTGKTDWGAEPEREYFIISWDE